jgi:hypothetical protein
MSALFNSVRLPPYVIFLVLRLSPNVFLFIYRHFYVHIILVTADKPFAVRCMQFGVSINP